MERTGCAKCHKILEKQFDLSMIHGATDLELCSNCWLEECQLLYRERTNRPDVSPKIAAHLAGYRKN